MQFLLPRRRVILLPVLDAGFGFITTFSIIELTKKGLHLWNSEIPAVGRTKFTSLSTMSVMRMLS